MTNLCQSVTNPIRTGGREFPCQNNGHDTLFGVRLCWRHIAYWKARLQVGERIRIHPQRLIWDYPEANSSPEVGTQRCRRCGEVKPLAEFIGSTGRKRSYCLPCNRAVGLEYWRKKHPPKHGSSASKEPPAPGPDDTFESCWADQGLSLAPAAIEDRPAPSPPPEQDARPPEDAQPTSSAPAGTPAVPDRPLPQHLHREEPRKAAAEPRAARAPLPTEARTSGVGDVLERSSASLSARESASAPAPEVRAGSSWHKPFVVHKPKRDAEVVTLPPEPTEAGGRGTRWPCNHAPDQLGGIRCINCCIGKPQHYVELVARGGTPARRRWLCDACLPLFEADGRVAGHERRYEVFAVPGYQDVYGTAASA